MANHNMKLNVNGCEVETLEDILPSEPGLRILFVAKTPAPVSVKAGHYFQGKQGKSFWNMLSKYDVIKVPPGEYEDDHLLENGFGITDIVKIPRDYGNEPNDNEYREGIKRILNLIEIHQPEVVVFVYKRVLDKILNLGFQHKAKAEYGFNKELEKYFGSKIFVYPMPGTPCNKAKAQQVMNELKIILHDKNI